MVASDVHGKNHHVAGTIGQHVESLLMRVASGELVRCSRTENSDLFLATLGGMGLTGHILEVSLRMEKIPSPWIYTESYRASCLDELLEMVRDSAKTWPMTVSWVDTVAKGKSLGRGILFVGRWATADEAPQGVPKERPTITAPFDLPSALLNRFTIGLFNQAIYGSHVQKVKKGIVNPDKYFYPLDSLHHWNRFYGRSGVTQHQSVIPWEHGRAGVKRLIDVLADAGTASFLTVIKDCGAEGDGILSFPKPGMSLALDIPIRQNTQEVVAKLNQVVRETGGRIYLTKDGLTTAEDFRAMEPRLEQFLAIKRKWDPEGRLESAQSQRLMG
jgi:FAD/FMN-containing dehydrogenase